MYLITGATGFLGAHITRQLSAKGIKTKAMYRTIDSIPSDLQHDANITWVKGDTLDTDSLETAMQDVEAVFHCAAKVSFNPKKAEDILHTNIQGTTNVVNTALHLQIKKLLFISSVAALGEYHKELINETSTFDPTKPSSAYAKSKYYSEMEVWRGAAEGLETVIINPAVIIGPNSTGRASGVYFDYARKKRIPAYTSGICGMVDVRDVAKAAILLMQSDIHNQRFLLCSENVTFKDLLTQTNQYFGHKAPSISIPYWLMRIASMLPSSKVDKYTAKSAYHHNLFDGSLITKSIDFSYTPIKQSVEDACKYE